MTESAEKIRYRGICFLVISMSTDVTRDYIRPNVRMAMGSVTMKVVDATTETGAMYALW